MADPNRCLHCSDSSFRDTGSPLNVLSVSGAFTPGAGGNRAFGLALAYVTSGGFHGWQKAVDKVGNSAAAVRKELGK
jgi:hypothetical protein